MFRVAEGTREVAERVLREPGASTGLQIPWQQGTAAHETDGQTESCGEADTALGTRRKPRGDEAAWRPEPSWSIHRNGRQRPVQ